MKSFADITKDELIEALLDQRARDIINFTNLLVAQTGKGKAKELIKKARWEAFQQRGKEAAEKAGNPRDLDSYLEAYWVKEMGLMPWVPPVKWEQKTATRAVATYTYYCIGKALAKLGDKVIKEIGKDAYCLHDIAWAKGFNPNIEVHLAKTYCAGDNCCQFVIELVGPMRL